MCKIPTKIKTLWLSITPSTLPMFDPVMSVYLKQSYYDPKCYILLLMNSDEVEGAPIAYAPKTEWRGIKEKNINGVSTLTYSSQFKKNLENNNKKIKRIRLLAISVTSWIVLLCTICWIPFQPKMSASKQNILLSPPFLQIESSTKAW